MYSGHLTLMWVKKLCLFDNGFFMSEYITLVTQGAHVYLF